MGSKKLASVTALSLLLLGIVWAFASPRGSSADEGFHLTNIWCAWGNSDLCQIEQETGVVLVPDSIANAACFTLWPSQNGAGCLKDLSMDLVQVGSTISIAEPTYSLGFFKTMRVFAGENIEMSVQIMRIFNGMISSLLFFWALVAATRPIARALAISWGVAIIPIGIFFIASVNPSSWVIMGVGTFWAFLASALGPGEKTKTQLWSLWLGAAVSFTVAMLARTDSGVYLCATIGAIFIWRWKSIRVHLSRTKVLIFLGGLAAIVLGTAMMLLSRYNQIQFSFPGAQTSTDQPVPLLKSFLELPSFLFGLFGGQTAKFIITDSEVARGVEGYRPSGFLFGVGWTEFPLPSLVGLLIGAAVFGTVVIGFTRYSKPRVFAVTFLVLAFVAQVVLMRASIDFGRAMLQPRYFFPYVLIILGLCVTISVKRGHFFSRVQLLLSSIPILIAGSLAWLATATRYAVSPSAAYTNFGQPLDWWWEFGPGRLTWFLVVILVSGLWVAVTLGLWGCSTSKHDRDGSEDATNKKRGSFL